MLKTLVKIASLPVAGLILGTGVSFGAAFTAGDVFASVGNGLVNEYTPTGALVQTLNTGHPGVFTTGSGFFSPFNGNLYVTDFNANAVTQFDHTTGALVGDFGSGYNSDPESIVFSSSSNVFVGQADGSHNILEFDSAGTLLNSFAPTVGPRGTDWIDLAADQHTIYYTSEGNTIRRFDTATNTQLSNFNVAPLPGSFAFALRIMANGDVLVADSSVVVLLDSAGNQIRTYSVPGNGGELFSLNLDPNGTSFWTGDDITGQLWEVDIATGAIQQQFSTCGGHCLFGVSIDGEITAGTVPEASQLGTSIALIGLLAVFAYWRKRKAGQIA